MRTLLFAIALPACWTSAPTPPAPEPPKPPKVTGCAPGMLTIPKGTFTMGHNSDDKYSYEAPEHEVTLDAYCFDRTEVTVAAYSACVAADACESAPTTIDNLPGNPVYPDDHLCNGGKEELAKHPINCVVWAHADAYCRWAGMRLPTEAEWEYAARGNDGREFPWGDDPPFNDRGQKRREFRLNFAAREFVRDKKITAPVGSFPDGASPFGALDMAGNVAEWTGDYIGFYGEAPEHNPTGAQPGELYAQRFHARFGADPDQSRMFRAVRGGGPGYTDGKEYKTYKRCCGLHPMWRDYDLGFRCAKSL